MNKNTDNSIVQLASELRWKLGDNFHDKLTEGIYTDASLIAAQAVEEHGKKRNYTLDSKIDKIVTSKKWDSLL